MMRTRHLGLGIFFLLLAAFPLLLAGCSDETGDAGKAPQAQGEPPRIKVIKALKRDVPFWGEFVAQVAARETVEVRARVEGFLQKMHFTEGEVVKKGQLLFEIDSRPLKEQVIQAQAQVDYIDATLEKAQRDFKRFAALFEEGVVSQDEYEIREVEVRTQQASLADARAQLENANIQLGYTRIHSPIEGVIGRLETDLGNLVGRSESTHLVTVSTIDPVYVDFSISERWYIIAAREQERRKQVEGQQHESSIQLILADGSSYAHKGKFTMMDRTVNPLTGTIGIRAVFPNPDAWLRPGQYARIKALIETRRGAVVVPSRAVLDVQGLKSLYVVGASGKVENRPVTLGFMVDNLVIVEAGLEEGEMFIADGVRRIRPGMTVSPVPVPMAETIREVPEGVETLGESEAKAAPATQSGKQ